MSSDFDSYRVLGNEVVVETHIKAKALVDDSPFGGVFWIEWSIRSIFIANILNDVEIRKVVISSIEIERWRLDLPP